MQTKALLVAAVAGLASAQLPIDGRGEFFPQGGLVRRQTANPLTASTCLAALSTLQMIETDVPTPPADINSFLATRSVTDPCATPQFTGSLSAEWVSYESAAQSWFAKHSADIANALSQCPPLTQYASAGPAGATCGAVATTGGAASTGAASTGGAATTGAATTGAASGGSTGAASTGAASTGAASSGASSAAASSTVSKALAPRETGMIAAGLAAAGFIGAVIAL